MREEIRDKSSKNKKEKMEKMYQSENKRELNSAHNTSSLFLFTLV